MEPHDEQRIARQRRRVGGVERRPPPL